MFVNTLLDAYKFRVFWGSPVDAGKYYLCLLSEQYYYNCFLSTKCL